MLDRVPTTSTNEIAGEQTIQALLATLQTGMDNAGFITEDIVDVSDIITDFLKPVFASWRERVAVYRPTRVAAASAYNPGIDWIDPDYTDL